jgi:D-glycero-alpha-D-manno-heptose-7-phosphate kinase
VTGDRSQVFRASAPVRLDFAGGWTDVAPFPVRERGVVVNAAIELRAHAEVRVGGDRYLLHSDDLDESQEIGGPGALAAGGGLDLLKAALRRSEVGWCTLRTRSDAPPGSGLGSSGALDVALTAALDAARGVRRTGAELAEEAFFLESVDAAMPGGRQDQYAAAFGRFHKFTFERGAVSVQPLKIDPAFAVELARHTVICYTGVSRVSSRTIERVVAAYERRDAKVTGALRAMVDLAEAMAEALEASALHRVARLLGANWLEQQRLDTAMRTAEMAELETAMTRAGSHGGKAAGAGAGGSMFFVVADPDRAVQAATGAGARILPCRWASTGVTVERGP